MHSAAEDSRVVAGAELGRFRLLEEIGGGSMGRVFRADDLLLGEVVAVKVMKEGFASRGEARERFRREVRLARRVTHPRVCRVHDLHEIDGLLLLSMDWLAGVALRALLRGGRALAVDVAVAVVADVAEGIAAAHASGVVHRDLKPGNVIVDDTRAVVCDFGIACADDTARLTAPGVVVATPAYASPELLAGGGGTAASDVYALGALAFRTLTGRAPVPGMASLVALPSLPMAAADMVAAALSPRPERRPTAAAFAAALREGDEATQRVVRPSLTTSAHD